MNRCLAFVEARLEVLADWKNLLFMFFWCLCCRSTDDDWFERRDSEEFEIEEWRTLLNNLMSESSSVSWKNLDLTGFLTGSNTWQLDLRSLSGAAPTEVFRL